MLVGPQYSGSYMKPDRKSTQTSDCKCNFLFIMALQTLHLKIEKVPPTARIFSSAISLNVTEFIHLPFLNESTAAEGKRMCSFCTRMLKIFHYA